MQSSFHSLKGRQESRAPLSSANIPGDVAHDLCFPYIGGYLALFWGTSQCS